MGFAQESKMVLNWKVFKDVKSLVGNMVVTLPLINSLHSPSMRERHWKSVAKVCEVQTLDHSNPTFCLKDLFDLRLHLYVSPIEDIVELAQKEPKIESKLEKIA